MFPGLLALFTHGRYSYSSALPLSTSLCFSLCASFSLHIIVIRVHANLSPPRALWRIRDRKTVESESRERMVIWWPTECSMVVTYINSQLLWLVPEDLQIWNLKNWSLGKRWTPRYYQWLKTLDGNWKSNIHHPISCLSRWPQPHVSLCHSQ